ncbi:MAG: aspartate/glutamate racemase family protein [Parvibaculaceae bacterium]
MLTPSSNTVLEPVTSEIVAGIANVSAHFSRFRVTQIGLSDADNKQFTHAEIVRAAGLLADAKVGVICWNGTSASWLGFENDEQLCAEIESATGILACTSTLAFREIFDRTKITKVGLVTPYTGDVQERIVANWAAAGIVCSGERHMSLTDNFSFSTVAKETIAEMVKDVARTKCDAVAVVCTNLDAATIAAELEREIGCPVYDSIAVTIWKSLELVDCDPGLLSGWGGPFRIPELRKTGARA